MIKNNVLVIGEDLMINVDSVNGKIIAWRLAIFDYPQENIDASPAISKNVAVVIATQTIYGRVHPYVYSALRMLSIKMKCIFAEDMLAETAYVKLGCVLAKTNNIDEVKKMMIADIAGEITERSDNSFLY